MLVAYYILATYLPTKCVNFDRYKHHYPFLETNGIVTIEDNRVGPLYKHVFPPALAPWLSFIGIPERVIGFYFSLLVISLLHCENNSSHVENKSTYDDIVLQRSFSTTHFFCIYLHHISYPISQSSFSSLS